MPEQTPPTDVKKTFAHRLLELLATEGYHPHLAPGGDEPSRITFDVDGTKYLIRCSDSDPDFVQICLGYLLGEGTNRSELTLLRAALAVQSKVKVVKVHLPSNLSFVEFQLELFLGGHPLSPALLGRCLGTLRASYRSFHEKTSAELPQARA